MTNDEIRELLALFNDSGVAEMEVQRGENRVRFRRAMINHDFAVHSAAPIQVAAPIPVVAAVPVAPPPLPPTFAGQKPAAQAAPEDTNEVVKSPIVGTFYECPSPGSAAFVKVGDNVEKGQVLCIIESMKLMNEIESEVAGTIVARLVENGRPVEYGEGLFLIKPR
jgi:acetyl-CoA carboxylase biotin carboxyl carrier protein